MAPSPLPWVSLASVAGALSVLAIQRRGMRSLPTGKARHRLLAGGIRACGAALWPALLLSLVPKGDRTSPALSLPLAWVLGMWSLDSYLMHHAKASDESVPAALRMEPGAVTAMSFGLCSLVGARADGPYTHLVLYAVVGCIVGVFPAHNLLPGSDEEIVFDNVQKTLLVWCVGLLLAGVSLAKASGGVEAA